MSILVDVAVDFVEAVSCFVREIHPLIICLSHLNYDKIGKVIKVHLRVNWAFDHG